MGSRFSASHTAAPSLTSQATVITVSGILKEYSAAPIPASIVLSDCRLPSDQSAPADSSSTSFLCDADALFVDTPVPALTPEQPVLPGRLYFELPNGMRRRPLTVANMCELAVRANTALEATAGRRGAIKSGKKNGCAVKVLPVVNAIVGREGSIDDRSGAGRRTAAVVSPLTRLAADQQLKRSAVALAASGPRRGAEGRVCSRYAHNGRSFAAMLGTIEEDVE